MDRENELVVDHFTRGELACKCGCGALPDFTPPQLHFLQAVSRLRTVMGVPLYVTSYVRCKNSEWWWDGTRHDVRHGDAIDLTSRIYNPMQIFIAAIKMREFTGFGIDMKRNFIHLDAKLGRFAIWKYENKSAVTLLRQSL
jgi:hypothetical protein